jgi:hypothetical protein
VVAATPYKNTGSGALSGVAHFASFLVGCGGVARHQGETQGDVVEHGPAGAMGGADHGLNGTSKVRVVSAESTVDEGDGFKDRVRRRICVIGENFKAEVRQMSTQGTVTTVDVNGNDN